MDTPSSRGTGVGAPTGYRPWLAPTTRRAAAGTELGRRGTGHDGQPFVQAVS